MNPVTTETKDLPATVPVETHAIEKQAMATEDLVGQVRHIQQIMASVMKKDVHYGTIPGCGDKYNLLMPGAHKLMLTFRLRPEFSVERIDLGDGNREYRTKARLYSIPTGNAVGQGVAACSTLETKYLNQGSNPANHYNTCEKMSANRALKYAVIGATAASDLFYHDLDDLEDNGIPVDGTMPAKVQSPSTRPADPPRNQWNDPPPPGSWTVRVTGDTRPHKEAIKALRVGIGWNGSEWENNRVSSKNDAELMAAKVSAISDALNVDIIPPVAPVPPIRSSDQEEPAEESPF